MKFKDIFATVEAIGLFFFFGILILALWNYIF